MSNPPPTKHPKECDANKQNLYAINEFRKIKFGYIVLFYWKMKLLLKLKYQLLLVTCNPSFVWNTP